MWGQTHRPNQLQRQVLAFRIATKRRSMLVKRWAIIEAVDVPFRNRKAVVDLDGRPVGFWLDRDDHPEMVRGTVVQVEFDPQDQFARIAE